MIRFALFAWGLPISLFWGWYGLSYNDIHFGLMILSRPFHDLFFELYSGMTGIDPETLPWIIAEICLVDTAIVFGGIFAAKAGARLPIWQRFRSAKTSAATERADQASPAE